MLRCLVEACNVETMWNVRVQRASARYCTIFFGMYRLLSGRFSEAAQEWVDDLSPYIMQ